MRGPAVGGGIAGPGGGSLLGSGAGVANGPGGGIADGAIIGAPTATGPAASDTPQLRQNFMPGGFSPRHALQIVGNPPLAAGVCASAAASALPQFKQNDDPGGLWWPQAEQRSIDPLWHRVSRKARRSGMAHGLFATFDTS